MKVAPTLLGVHLVFLACATVSIADCDGGNAPGPWRFGTLNLLPDEVAILHVSTYPGDPKRPSGRCAARIAFLSPDGDVFQEGRHVLEAGRGLDVAFYGPAVGVYEFHPVIEPIGPCNVDIVPLLQVQEQAAGTGKTLYVYAGQPSVAIRRPRPSD